MAFSKACSVIIRDGRKSSRTISTIRRPATVAKRKRRESGAGIDPLPGKAIPKASAERVHC